MKTNVSHCTLIFLIVTLLCGCQSPTMKGTPFYTGEYEGSSKAHTDRVNLWPLLYYREPALSVLWPVFEVTDDHTAVRPLFSVYNKTDDNPVYNVLWPVTRFDTKNENSHIIPVFWGKNQCASGRKANREYFVVAPLYWHFHDPFGGDGVNALWPLWVWNVDSEEKRLDVFWPLYADKTGPGERLWRLWPVYGTHSKRDGENRSRFWAGGLVYRTNDRDNTWTALMLGAVSWKMEAEQLTRTMVIPFYSWEQDDHFYTLLYGRDEKKSWYATPLVGRHHKTRWDKKLIDCKGGWVWPLWGHKESEKEQRTYAMLGIWRHRKSDRSENEVLFPLYTKGHHSYSRHNDRSQTWRREYASTLLLYSNKQRTLTDANGEVLRQRNTTELFPIWKTETEMDGKDKQVTTDTTSYLFRLYDTRRETPHDESKNVYTRHRVLWRLYHKETLDGDSSTDIFPAIAIDRKHNGFKKYAFLWRLFRYEVDPETDTTKLDLCFIPLRR